MSNPLRDFALDLCWSSLRNPVGGRWCSKLRGEGSGGAMTVFESVVAPAEGPALHLHEASDDWLCVLEGEMRIRLGDDVILTPAGSFAFIPAAWHTTGRTWDA